MKLLRVFRDDRLLALLTVVLAICSLVPLWVTPILPFVDLPTNVGAASLLWDTQFGTGLPAHHYQVNWAPIPYWTAYLIMAAASALGGPLFAAKAIVGLINLLLPLSTMRLMIALGRDPRLGLWSFALVWDHSAYWGWQSFLLGMALSLYFLAKMIEAQTVRQALLLIPFSALIALTHALPLGLLLVAGGLLLFAGRNFFQRVLVNGIAMSGGLLPAVPWLLSRFKPTLAQNRGLKQAIQFSWDTPGQKVTSLYRFTLDNVPHELGSRLLWLAFIVLLLGPLLLLALRRDRRQGERRGAIAILLSCLSLYFFLPMAVNGPVQHWYTYPRYATFILLSLLLVPRPRLDRWRALALVPGIVAVLLVDYAVGSQFVAFGKNVRPFLEIMNAVRPNSAVLTLAIEGHDPVLKPELEAYKMLQCYIVGATKGYEPGLFNYPSNPLLFRAGRAPAIPRRRGDFSMAKHGTSFDYILTSPSQDPFVAGRSEHGAAVHLVKDAGRWRLYENLERARTAQRAR